LSLYVILITYWSTLVSCPDFTKSNSRQTNTPTFHGDNKIIRYTKTVRFLFLQQQSNCIR